MTDMTQDVGMVTTKVTIKFFLPTSEANSVLTVVGGKKEEGRRGEERKRRGRKRKRGRREKGGREEGGKKPGLRRRVKKEQFRMPHPCLRKWEPLCLPRGPYLD